MGNRKERKQNFCILEDFKQNRLQHNQKEFWNNNNKDGWERRQTTSYRNIQFSDYTYLYIVKGTCK